MYLISLYVKVKDICNNFSSTKKGISHKVTATQCFIDNIS
jgi:hypothetical protein